MTPLLAGKLSFIQDPLQNLLFWIQDTTQLSWAWSIIVLTALVRIAIMPITIKQTRSMLAMQVLQPYVKQLQERYKDDRQALNEAVMTFYRDNKVNPLASCLPILLQIPVFTALFFVLKDLQKNIPAGASTDFSFLFGFIDDITVHVNDGGLPAYLLLAFYVLSQMFSSLVMMTSPDPKQKYMMMLLPLFFVIFVVNFPIGVMIYWIMTNLWTLGQHVVVKRLTKLPQEVILPPDNRGNSKVVQAKGPKHPKGGKTSSKGTTASTPKSKTAGNEARRAEHARKNKRRR